MTYPFAIDCTEGWCDITHEVEGDAPPWTLARPDGVGALQFSTALYRSGPVPNPSAADLLSMLREFASERELGKPFDIVTDEGELRLAAASFRWQPDFIRVWYLFHGSSFVKVSYTCAWGKQRAELSDCEQMLRTLRFTDETDAD